MSNGKRKPLLILVSVFFFTLLLSHSSLSAEETSGIQLAGHKQATQIEGSGKGKQLHHGLGYGQSRSSHRKSYGHGSGGHYGKHGYHSSPFTHVLRFKKELGLTEDQINTINDQKFEYDKIRIRAKGNLEIARMDLNRLLHAATIDETAILRLAEQIGDLKKEKVRTKVEAKLKLLGTLTDTQKEQINKMYRAHQ